jgi:hypothetical protein
VNKHQKKAIKKAVKEYGTITPCSHKESLDDCFSEHRGELHLWFNVGTGTTRTTCVRLPDSARPGRTEPSTDTPERESHA